MIRHAAVSEFFDALADELLGSLADQVAVREYDEEPFVWRHGFLHRVRLDAQLSQIRALLAHPSARFVAESLLRLHRRGNRVPRRQGTTDAARARAASMRDIGDLGALWQAVPHLRSLRVHARDFEIDAIDLPEVERVDLAARLLSGSCVRAIASAAWPRLERLALRLGNFVPRTERTATFDDFLPLLRRTDLFTAHAPPARPPVREPDRDRAPDRSVRAAVALA